MKRLLLLIAVLLIYSLVNVQGFSTLNPGHIEVAFITSAIEDQHAYSGPSDVTDHSAIKVRGPYSLRPLLPCFQKFSISRLSLNEEAGLQARCKLSTYVFYTESHIIRLEAEDIIHPFHYFW